MHWCGQTKCSILIKLFYFTLFTLKMIHENLSNLNEIFDHFCCFKLTLYFLLGLYHLTIRNITEIINKITRNIFVF